jgi:N-glycosidase YbiA
MDRIEFYTTKTEHGYMSNFYRAEIKLDGKKWMTTEHYYQAQKSLDPEEQELVRLAANPKMAARLGRVFLKLREDWEDVKFDIMRKAVYAKFDQHPKLKEKLLGTGEALLVEHTVGTPRPDPVWGDGIDGTGANWLGRILMEYREEKAP